MDTEQVLWAADSGWSSKLGALDDAQLVLVFGAGNLLERETLTREISAAYPSAEIVGCSTAGEIAGTRVNDETLSLTAVRFRATTLKTADVHLGDFADSATAGTMLASRLPREGLVHAFVVADGQHVNGSDLVRGITSTLPPGVTLTGGLAGDGSRFERTVVLRGGGAAAPDRVALVGFYGPSLRVGFGSLGGWDAFGAHRKITRSKGNVLYELDGEPALQLYKRYLGEHAEGLPSTGLLFPLSLKLPGSEVEVVRTILAVDDAAQSLTFAGDLPEGSLARLMKANFDRLVDGAHGAAQRSHETLGAEQPELAILISCVGRKLVLKGRTEEELEAVREVLGPKATMTGFYSYGEICPAAPNAGCDLHNQTMTITTFREA